MVFRRDTRRALPFLRELEKKVEQTLYFVFVSKPKESRWGNSQWNDRNPAPHHLRKPSSFPYAAGERKSESKKLSTPIAKVARGKSRADFEKLKGAEPSRMGLTQAGWALSILSFLTNTGSPGGPIFSKRNWGRGMRSSLGSNETFHAVVEWAFFRYECTNCSFENQR